jgi:hypothetical protein
VLSPSLRKNQSMTNWRWKMNDFDSCWRKARVFYSILLEYCVTDLTFLQSHCRMSKASYGRSRCPWICVDYLTPFSRVLVCPYRDRHWSRRLL